MLAELTAEFESGRTGNEILAAARSAADALRIVLDPDAAGTANVRWIERRGRAPRLNLALAAAPVELGPELRESLRSVVGGRHS